VLLRRAWSLVRKITETDDNYNRGTTHQKNNPIYSFHHAGS